MVIEKIERGGERDKERESEWQAVSIVRPLNSINARHFRKKLLKKITDRFPLSILCFFFFLTFVNVFFPVNAKKLDDLADVEAGERVTLSVPCQCS